MAETASRELGTHLMSLLCHLVKQEGLCLALLGLAQNLKPLCNHFWFKVFIPKFSFPVALHCVWLAEVPEPRALLPDLFPAGSEQNGLFVRLRTSVLLAPWVVFPFLF